MKPRRVLFVTVGTTVLTASNLGALGEGDPEQLRREAIDFDDGAIPKPDLYERVLAAHEAFWNSGLSVFENRYDTSAEMASSFYALRVQGNEKLFDPKKDRIVLLSSQTDACLFCANVNEQLMRKHLFHPPCDGERATYVEVVKGLQAKEAGFADSIVASIEEFWNCHYPLEEIIVNITGGFKGTIPALTWRCLKTDTSKTACSMFYTHETMDRAETITFSLDSKPRYTGAIIT